MARTGSRSGTAAVLAMLIATVGTSCSGGQSGGGHGGGTSSGPAAASPPPAPAPAPSGGGFVNGSGYRFALPRDWHDTVAVAVVGTSTLVVDRAVTGRVTTHDVAPTVAVLVEPTYATLETYAGSRRDLLGVLADAEPLSLAGVPALALQYADRDLLTREVICVRRGQVYLVVFTAHNDSFHSDAAALNHILHGWSWV